MLNTGTWLSLYIVTLAYEFRVTRWRKGGTEIGKGGIGTYSSEESSDHLVCTALALPQTCSLHDYSSGSGYAVVARLLRQHSTSSAVAGCWLCLFFHACCHHKRYHYTRCHRHALNQGRARVGPPSNSPYRFESWTDGHSSDGIAAEDSRRGN